MKKEQLSKEQIISQYQEYVIKVGSKVSDWKQDDNQKITLYIENKGLMNLIMQKLIQKPKVSYVHLDDKGSFLWSMFDGKTKVSEISKRFVEKFGDDALPLYERLFKYFEILESYNFIEILKPSN